MLSKSLSMCLITAVIIKWQLLPLLCDEKSSDANAHCVSFGSLYIGNPFLSLAFFSWYNGGDNTWLSGNLSSPLLRSNPSIQLSSWANEFGLYAQELLPPWSTYYNENRHNPAPLSMLCVDMHYF